MVGWVAGFFGLIGRTLPDLNHPFRALRRFLGTRLEAAVGQGRLSSTDFSRCVLARSPAHLAVLAVREVAWSDLGTPERVVALRPGRAALRDEIGGPTVVAAAAG